MPLATGQNVIPANNVEVSVVSGEPATYDQAGFEALSWNQIGALISAGAFGPQTEMGSVKLVGANSDTILPGTTNFGQMPVTVALVDDGDDDGQDVLKTEALSATKTKHSVKIEFTGTGAASNLTYYGVVYIGGFQIDPNSPPNAVQATAQFGFTREFVKVPGADT